MLILDVFVIILLLFDLFWVNKMINRVLLKYDSLEELIFKNENSLKTIEMMNTKVKRMEKIISAYQDDLK